MLSRIMSLKLLSCPQMSSEVTAGSQRFTFNSFKLSKVEFWVHRPRLAPRAHHTHFCSFLISSSSAFPSFEVFSFWEQKGGSKMISAECSVRSDLWAPSLQQRGAQRAAGVDFCWLQSVQGCVHQPWVLSQHLAFPHSCISPFCSEQSPASPSKSP